jgi:hypothetical protein
MAKTWFPHEDNLKEGEESKPLYGPRYSLFWFFAYGVTILGALGLGWMFLKFLFSGPHQ